MRKRRRLLCVWQAVVASLSAACLLQSRLSPPLEIALSPNAPATVPLGGAPAISVVARNRGNRPFRVVAFLDGSDWGRRSPLLWFEVYEPQKGWVKLYKPIGRCGNTNPISTSSFAAVNPGQSVVLCAALPHCAAEGFKDLGAGARRIRALYDTTAPLENWLGGPLPPDLEAERAKAVKPLLEEVPKGRFATGSVVVTTRAF